MDKVKWEVIDDIGFKSIIFVLATRKLSRWDCLKKTANYSSCFYAYLINEVLGMSASIRIFFFKRRKAKVENEEHIHRLPTSKLK